MGAWPSGGAKKPATTEIVPKRHVQDLFKPSTELEKLRGLKMGVFGRAKKGKTHLALTAPAPRYVIDTEGSVRLNIKQFSKEHQEQTFVSEVLEYSDKKTRKINLFKSLDALIMAVDSLTDMLTEEQYQTDKPGTIIIDSASDVWDWMITWMEEKSGGEHINRLQWGVPNRTYADFMYMLLRSNWNVVMTFRAEAAVSDKGSDLGYDKPKMQKKTDYWLDLITEIRQEGTDRVLIFRGDRFGGITETLTNPTWDKIVALLNKKCKVKVA